MESVRAVIGSRGFSGGGRGLLEAAVAPPGASDGVSKGGRCLWRLQQLQQGLPKAAAALGDVS